MNNREILAKNISERFVSAISGNDITQILEHNPEDRIYVGKLSPQSKEESLSSSVLIKQISVNFRIPKNDVHTAKLNIYPQGNFFFRVIPTLAQQRDYFIKDFNLVFKTSYKTFEEFVDAYNSGSFTNEMSGHKVQLLPVYEKIAIDRNNVFFSVNVVDFYNKIHKLRIKLKTALLDQTILAGLGNIYVDEVCYLSNLHPEMPCNYLTLYDCKVILEKCKYVLEGAIKAGGTTIRSYTSSLGVTGRFQLKLHVHTKVGEPCEVCNLKIKKIFKLREA